MTKSGSVLLVDGHVHLYACFDPQALLDAAWTAFATRARTLGLPRWQGVLLLTESRRDAVFEELVASGTSKGRSLGHWSIGPANEPECLRLTAPGEKNLFIVSGFQVATREDLEVLAIGTRIRVPDGQEFFETFRQVKDTGAFPVIPWGFGKWSLGRGRTIGKLIESTRPGELAFGDNGGRIAGLPTPRLLKLAASKGFAILPGTDPLPFADQAARVGTSGFALPAGATGEGLVAGIKTELAHSGGLAAGFLSLSNPISFAVTQTRMQLRKRLG